jgi:AraC family transcriptional activator FtrA
VLFVDDGDVLTAAGSAAALDLGLHLVRPRPRGGGRQRRQPTTRLLAHRDGGQRQFVDRPLPAGRDSSLGPLLDWARGRLDQPLGVRELAAQVAVSPATLHRRFAAELGCTPLAG